MSVPLSYRIKSRAKKSLAWLRGFLMQYIVLPQYRLLRHPIRDLSAFARRVPFIERREYAQNGEDGMLVALFAMIGTTNKYYVEFGVEDGMQCNTRYLMKHREWSGLLMDSNHEDLSINLHREFITAENIEGLLGKHGVPREFDLLSIDIDGNDYWVWQAITHFYPRVVVIEYNACIPYKPAVTIPYQADFVWDKTDYYGASLSALVALGLRKKYTLIATDPNGVNAFFVLSSLLSGNLSPPDPEQIYRPAAFKGKAGLGHPKDPKQREWTSIP